jgi:hypothetical protein
MNFVKAINEIHSNIWAVVIIVSGVILYCCNKPDVASGLLGGGFMLMRSGQQSISEPTPVVVK